MVITFDPALVRVQIVKFERVGKNNIKIYYLETLNAEKLHDVSGKVAEIYAYYNQVSNSIDIFFAGLKSNFLLVHQFSLLDQNNNLAAIQKLPLFKLNSLVIHDIIFR